MRRLRLRAALARRLRLTAMDRSVGVRRRPVRDPELLVVARSGSPASTPAEALGVGEQRVDRPLELLGEDHPGRVAGGGTQGVDQRVGLAALPEAGSGGADE